jgi:hypothetical protein
MPEEHVRLDRFDEYSKGFDDLLRPLEHCHRLT